MSDEHEHAISRAELASMATADVVLATREGRLKHLLDPKSVTPEDVERWDAASVVAAAGEGRLRHLGIGVDDEGHVASTADQGARGTAVRNTREAQRALIRSLPPGEVSARLKRGDFDALLRGELA